MILFEFLRDPRCIEAFLSLCGAAGLLLYVRVLYQQNALDMITQRLLFLLLTAAVLLSVRAPYWGTGNIVMGRLTFLLASVCIFALFLYSEALLKRHMPLLGKWLAIIGSVGLGLASIVVPAASFQLLQIGLGIHLVLMQLVIIAVFFSRPGNDLTPAENRFITSLAFTILTSAPFLLTDILADMGRPVPRLGTIGILIILYSLIRLRAAGSNWIRSLQSASTLIAVAGLFTVAESELAGGGDLKSWVRTFSLFYTLLLLQKIYLELRSLQKESHDTAFLRRLSFANEASIEDFVASLADGELITGLCPIENDEAEALDPVRIQNLFTRVRSRIITLSTLRREIGLGKADDLFIREQLVDLMERNFMSHAVLVTQEPLVLILAQIPHAGRERDATLQLRLIRKMARLLVNRTRTAETRIAESAESAESEITGTRLSHEI